jgi:hypothetical protein
MSQIDKINKLGVEWFNANRDKNDGANRERKAKEQLQKEVIQYNDSIPVHLKSNRPVSIEISDTVELEVGVETWPDEEIDAKKLFQENPDLFWSLCSIPKGAVISAIGEKGAAKLMRTVSKTDFKIRKVKKTK